MDLEQENRLLRQKLLELNREAQNNEATLKRFHSRELELLTCDSLPELLNSLTDGMQTSFQIKSIQLILQDPQHEMRHLLSNIGIPETAFPNILFVDDLDSINQRYCSLHKPWLGPFQSPEYDGMFKDTRELRSIAILPIFCRSRRVGSLNLGSSSSDRLGNGRCPKPIPPRPHHHWNRTTSIRCRRRFERTQSKPKPSSR